MKVRVHQRWSAGSIKRFIRLAHAPADAPIGGHTRAPISGHSALLCVHQAGVVVPLALVAYTISVQSKDKGHRETHQPGDGTVVRAAQTVLIKANHRAAGRCYV